MSKKLKDQLIKLGSENKSLRKHIRPVLAELKKQERAILSSIFRIDLSWSAVKSRHLTV